MNEALQWLTAIGTLCAAASLAAQTPPLAPDETTGDDGIVVTGKTQPHAGNAAFDQARNLSRVDRPYEQALARFERPVCPGIFGLEADYAAAMIDRVRDNAARAKAPLAKERCSPNLVIAFVDNGQSLLGKLEREQPELFSRVAASERSELLRGARPVRVLSNVATRRANGAPLARYRGREVQPAVRGRSISESFFLPTRRDIETALVVFDREAVRGMTLVQLADYATMRGLTHTRPASSDVPLQTILSLFEDDAAAPPELTSFDESYLRTVYYWDPTYSAATKFVGIESQTAKASHDLKSAPAN